MEIKEFNKIKARLEKLDKIKVTINRKMNDRHSIALSRPNGEIVGLYDGFFLVDFKGIRECFLYADVLVGDIEITSKGEKHNVRYI